MTPGFLLSAVLALSSCVLAVPTSPLNDTAPIVGRTCGSNPSADEVAAAEAHFAQHKVTPDPTAARTISVYFHVIYENNSCVSPFSR